MPEYTITALETYRVTHKIKANSKAEAIRIWESMNIRQAERVVSDDINSRRINDEEF